jgi:hypothetical protein
MSYKTIEVSATRGTHGISVWETSNIITKSRINCHGHHGLQSSVVSVDPVGASRRQKRKAGFEVTDWLARLTRQASVSFSAPAAVERGHLGCGDNLALESLFPGPGTRRLAICSVFREPGCFIASVNCPSGNISRWRTTQRNEMQANMQS